MSSKLDISKLKSYHIFLLGCLLGVLLVLNSNHVNEDKFRIQQNKKEEALFNRLIGKRKLQEDPLVEPNVEEEEEYITETEAVCSHASIELQEYYNTSDLSKIDLDDGAIKCEDKDQDYMTALINIVKSLLEGDSDDEEDEGDGNIEPQRRNLRNLLEAETEENIKKYASRVLPILIFFVFSILSLIGWIVCCFCNCCNCCCCCCCKKVKCKIPCLLFAYVFYAGVIAVCIYGVTQSNKIFTGLANTECSFMQFFDTILFGETTDKSPKWIGIENVANILNNLNDKIREMSGGSLEMELDQNMDNIEEQRDLFLPQLKSVHSRFYPADDETIPKEGYYIEYTTADNKFIEVDSTNSLNLKGKYVLDLIPLFGKYDAEKENFTGLNSIWNIEIDEIDRRAGGAMEEARGSFSSMLGENLGKIEDGLALGKDKLDKLKKPFDNVYNKISGALYDASELMNDKGEMGIKLVFGTLAILNVILAIDMLFICCFSGKNCVNCCCCRCIFKFSAHLIWNILALLMIITFLVGSLLALVGRIGGDMMSLVSYVMSEDNFNSNNPVLINKLGGGKDILEECIVGEGNLSKVFELDDITGDFDTLYSVKDDIKNYKSNFTSLAQTYPAYHYLTGILNNRTEFREDTAFYRLDYSQDEIGVSPVIKLSEIMKLLNDSIGTSQPEKWNPYNGDKRFVCSNGNAGSGPSGSPSGNKLHPWTCEPIYRGWVDSSSDTKIKNYAQIVSDAIGILKFANNTKRPDNPDYESYLDVLNNLKASYENYLNTFVDVLDFFDIKVGSIIDTLEEGIGNSNETFSFLNGKFIKTNLKILLKYLKYSLGQDIYNVGVCLIIVGCSLIFSISSTILLIVILNIVLEENKKLAHNDDVPDFPIANDGRVIQYKN